MAPFSIDRTSVGKPSLAHCACTQHLKSRVIQHFTYGYSWLSVHSTLVDSSVSMSSGLTLADVGMRRWLMSGSQCVCSIRGPQNIKKTLPPNSILIMQNKGLASTSSRRICVLKAPAYVTKEELNNTSPIRLPSVVAISTMLSLQRANSPANPVIRRCASAALLAVRSACKVAHAILLMICLFFDAMHSWR